MSVQGNVTENKGRFASFDAERDHARIIIRRKKIGYRGEKTERLSVREKFNTLRFKKEKQDTAISLETAFSMSGIDQKYIDIAQRKIRCMDDREIQCVNLYIQENHDSREHAHNRLNLNSVMSLRDIAMCREEHRKNMDLFVRRHQSQISDPSIYDIMNYAYQAEMHDFYDKTFKERRTRYDSMKESLEATVPDSLQEYYRSIRPALERQIEVMPENGLKRFEDILARDHLKHNQWETSVKRQNETQLFQSYHGVLNEIHGCNAELARERNHPSFNTFVKLASLHRIGAIIHAERVRRQTVHDPHVENLTKELGGYVCSKTPVTEQEAAKVISEMREEIAERFKKVTETEQPAFLEDQKKYCDLKEVYFAPANEAMRLKKAMDFLDGDIMSSPSKIKLNAAGGGEQEVTLMQFAASIMKSCDNPNMHWQEGLSDPQERRRDMMDQMIETLYENQRSYNMNENENGDILYDDMAPEDKLTCMPGAANRFAAIAQTFVKIMDDSGEDNVVMPSISEYTKELHSVTNKVLSEAKAEDLTTEQQEHVRQVVRNLPHNQVNVGLLVPIFGDKIRNQIKENLPALKKDENRQGEDSFWDMCKEHIEYITLPEDFYALQHRAT